MRFVQALCVIWVLASACARTAPLTPRGTVPNGADGGTPTGPCMLTVLPTDIDFGELEIGAYVTAPVHLTNAGGTACRITSVKLDPGSDHQFGLLGAPPVALTIDPDGDAFFSVTFWAQDDAKPHLRTGTLHVATPETGGPYDIPLKAQIILGCDLKVSPNPLDFGNVPLNTSLTDAATLTNQGTSPCDITNIALATTSDPLFSLPSDQPTGFSLAPDDSAPIKVTFAADDSTAPHLRKGTLDFTVTQPSGKPLKAPQAAAIPIQAYISTECTAGSQWIYTIDSTGMLSLFNPTDLSFTDIGMLNCPDYETPFSMAIDQHTVAWVEYMDGQIFRVDTTNANCSPTNYVVDSSLMYFGMGFVFDPTTGVDTLYVAGGLSNPSIPSELATISFPSMSLNPVAQLQFGDPELTGTGDGQLWGFAPSTSSQTGVTTLAQIDPATGTVIQSYGYPEIGDANTSYALKFWGGSFYLFLNSSVYQVPRTTGIATLVVPDSGHDIVGAGVSTCAPVQ